MDTQALYTALKPFLPSTTIWANQNAARPALPYATLVISSSVAMGTETEKGTTEYSGQREDTLRIETFGDGAFQILQDLRNRLPTTTLRYPFLRAGFVVSAAGPVTDISQLIGGVEIEPRAMLELTIRYRSLVTEVVEEIDTVSTVGSVLIGGTLGPLPINVTATRSTP